MRIHHPVSFVILIASMLLTADHMAFLAILTQILLRAIAHRETKA